MKYIKSDKYEKKLWILSFVYLFFDVVVLIFLDIVDSTEKIEKYPTWWGGFINNMHLILVALFILFGFIVIFRGKKIMKSEEYQKKLLKDKNGNINNIPKLTKEEENKKYGL